MCHTPIVHVIKNYRVSTYTTQQYIIRMSINKHYHIRQICIRFTNHYNDDLGQGASKKSELIATKLFCSPFICGSMTTEQIQDGDDTSITSQTSYAINIILIKISSKDYICTGPHICLLFKPLLLYLMQICCTTFSTKLQPLQNHLKCQPKLLNDKTDSKKSVSDSTSFIR